MKRVVVALVAVAVLAAAVFVGVKAEVIRPNMIFVPDGVKGVDVSEYQGVVDFGSLSDAGVEFVYAKATEGASYVDAQFEATCGQASGSRIGLGAYHFFSFDSVGEGIAQLALQKAVVQEQRHTVVLLGAHEAPAACSTFLVLDRSLRPPARRRWLPLAFVRRLPRSQWSGYSIARLPARRAHRSSAQTRSPFTGVIIRTCSRSSAKT